MRDHKYQCNKEEGKKANSQSFMWVMRSAASEAKQGIFFYYSRTRSGDIARDLLKDFHGCLITDAYSGYEKVSGIKVNGRKQVPFAIVPVVA